MNNRFQSANRTAQNNYKLNHAARRKQVLRQATLEQLELRTLLSTVDITAGAFTFAASSASSLTVSSDGTNDTFVDSSQTITLTANAVSAGWTGSGTNTVTGPESSITSISIGGSNNAGQSLTLDFGSGGEDPLPASGLTYDPTAASSGINSLTLENGSFTSESYSATGAGSGAITYSDLAQSNVVISYSNLSPLNDTVPSPNFTFIAPAGATTVNVNTGPVVGVQTDQINDGGTGAFELINFANKTTVTVDVNVASATTTLNIPAVAVGLSTLNVDSMSGGDNVNVQAIPSAIAVNVDMGGVSGSTTTVGLAGSTAAISSPVAVISTGGSNTLTIDDSADTASASATLDTLSGNVNAPFEVTGLSPAAIEYGAGVTALNITGGTSGGNGVTFHINNTQAATTTTINGSDNQNIFDLSNSSESGGLDNLAGPVVVNGGSGGSDVVTLDDLEAPNFDTYTITDTTVTQNDAFGGLTYGGIGTLNVSTGSTNGLAINVSASSVPTNLTLNASGTVNIGSTGGNGTMEGILGAIGITDTSSTYTLTFHDENDTVGQTWTLNNSDSGPSGSIAVTGSSTISYDPSDLSSLTLNGGSGGNTFNANNTSAFYPTTLNAGTGDDAVNVFTTGDNTLDINGQAGQDTVTLGANASAPLGVQGLNGTINVGNTFGFSDLSLDDSEDTTGQTALLFDDGTNGQLTGLAPATINYPNTDISSVAVSGGSGGNTFTVDGTLANPSIPNTLTTLNKGSGSNTVNVEAITSGSTLDLTGTGSPDTINLGSSGNLSAIQGTLTINEAAGSTNLVIDLSSDPSTHAFDLSSDGTTSTLFDTAGDLPNPITFNTAAIATLTIVGNSSQDESLNIDFGSGGFDPIPSGSPGLVFNAGDPGNGVSHVLTFSGELGTGPFASETHTANDQSVFPAVGQYGSFAFDDGTGSATALTSINYTGLNPIIDTVPAVNYTFNDAADDNSFTAVDGPVSGGFQTIEFQNTPESGPPTFETTDIANKVNVVFNTTATPGMSGVVNITTPSTGLTTLTFNTLTNGENDVTVIALPAGIVTAINGGTDQDTTNVTGSDINAGDTLVLTGGPGVDTLNYNANGLTPTITAGGAAGEVLITIPGSGTVDATGYENVDLTNVAPVVITPGATVPVSAVEGAPKNVTVGTFTLPLAAIGITNPAGLPTSDFAASINWGDGSSSAGTITQDATNPSLYYITGTHTYAAAGDFTVSDTIAFAGATYSNNLNGATVSVTVAPAGPTAGTSATATVAAAALSAQSATVTGMEGISLGSIRVASFIDSGTVGLPAAYTATINWGDGSAPTAASSITSTGTSDGVIFSVFGTHAYAGEGNYAITVTITKTASGAEAIASSQAVIADATLTAGVPAALTPHTGATISPAVGSFTDADPIAPISDFTAILFWGDGSNSAGTISQPGGVGTPFIVTGTHAYATPGTYTITTNVTDVGGSAATLTDSATVTDLPVTGAVNNFTAVAGQNTGTIVLATFTDPNPLATVSDVTATVPVGGFGDGTPTTPMTLAVMQIGGTATSTLFEVLGSHTYAAQGSYTVNINVTTSGGVTTALTPGTAAISSLVPATTPTITSEVKLSTGNVTVATFNDSNPNTTAADYSAIIDWGDGSPTSFGTITVTPGVDGAPATVKVNGMHTYLTYGQYNIIVTATEGDQTVTTTTLANATQPHLVFVNGPITTVAGNTLPVIKVYADDAFGNLAFQDHSKIKMEIFTGTPAEGKLIGVVKAKIKDGIAQFGRIGLKIAGDYTLVAVDGRYAQAVSSIFSITPAAPKKIAFTSLPANAAASNPFGVQVQIWDKYGNLEKSDSSIVTLTLGKHPRHAALSGVTSVTATGGIADFNHLVVSASGNYKLVATDSELPHKQPSEMFDVG